MMRRIVVAELAMVLAASSAQAGELDRNGTAHVGEVQFQLHAQRNEWLKLGQAKAKVGRMLGTQMYLFAGYRKQYPYGVPNSNPKDPPVAVYRGGVGLDF